MRYEVTQVRPGAWKAEATDEGGRFYTVIFTGPHAEKRARWYASTYNLREMMDLIPVGLL